MSAKQKIVHGRGLSNLNLGIFVAPLMFAGLTSLSPLLTMLRSMVYRSKSDLSTCTMTMNNDFLNVNWNSEMN